MGAIVALAHALRERPVRGVRVLLVSTGSEESFMEGMQAFGRRHFPGLPRETTDFVCLECVGSPFLCVVEGEGMLPCATTRRRPARRWPGRGTPGRAGAPGTANARAHRTA